MNGTKGSVSPTNDIELLLQAAEYLDSQDKRDRGKNNFFINYFVWKFIVITITQNLNMGMLPLLIGMEMSHLEPK